MEYDNKSLAETARTSAEELQQLKNALGTLEADRNTIQEALNSLKGEKLLVEQQLAEQQTENQNRVAELTERIAAVIAAKESVEADLSQKRTENEELLKEKSALATQHTELKENTDRVSKETEERCAHLEARIKEMESQLNEEKSAVTRKEEELATVQNELKSADAEYKAKLDVVTADHAEIVERLEQNRLAIETAASVKLDLEKAKESAELEAEQLKEEVSRLTKDFQQIKGDYDKLVESKTEVDDQLRQQKDAFIALQNTVDASKLGGDAMAKELAAAQELSSERLAEANRLQALVQ
ncbi:hypothetical protein ANCDUO_27652, partial [Ancylostoma duodenale]